MPVHKPLAPQDGHLPGRDSNLKPGDTSRYFSILHPGRE